MHFASPRGEKCRLEAEYGGKNRQAAAAYLRDMRGDFKRIRTVCRLPAPWNPDPNFSTALLRQWVVFHGYYAVAQSSCRIGCFCWLPLDFSGLPRILKQSGMMASDTPRVTDAMVLEDAGSDA